MTDLTDLTLHEAYTGLNKGDISSVELTQAYLDRIGNLDEILNAYITVTNTQALEQAQQADVRRSKGEDTPFLGIPLAYKDILCTQGVETTCGSQILKGYLPPYTATVIEKLSSLGAVMLGKTNMDEFGMGSSNENSSYGLVRNPWDTDYVPGGSSGGSAAAVAARLAIASLGTDTGGSVRQPASFCGVVGLKPSYGRVSRYGLIAYSSSLDTIGPLTRTVTDAAHMLTAISGHDPLDSTSMPSAVPDYTAILKKDLKGVRVGIPAEYFIEGIDSAIEEAVRIAIDQLSELGAEIKEISLPHTDYSLATYYLIAAAEASSNLARFDGVRYGPRAEADDLLETYRQTRGSKFGTIVKGRIMLGTHVLSAGNYETYYVKAKKIRTLIKRDFDEAFKNVDVIVSPTTPISAFKIGERNADPHQMILSDAFALAVNLAGICGVSIPCGFDGNGLPIGLQFIGPAFGEEAILQAGYAYEQATEWHRQTAPLD